MKLRKRVLLAILTVLVSILTFAISSSAAGFDKSKIYNETFSDVSADAWYFNDVKTAYELSLINGISDKEFSPDGAMTVAQAITLASRMNAVYNEKKILTGDVLNWYDTYVNYAKTAGFLKDDTFVSMDIPITRGEMALLFVQALPNDYYNPKNEILKIPDVKITSLYYDALMTLYKAGVVMGNDAYGTFNPDAFIKRSEVAAIINRVAMPENRLTKTLIYKTVGTAYTLVNNTEYTSHKSGIASGWNYNNQGGPVKTSENGDYGVSDISSEYGVSLSRDLSIVSEGTIDCETSFTFMKNFDGFYVEFLDSNMKEVYKLITENNKFKLLSEDGKYTEIFENVENKKNFTFKIVLDFDTNISKTFINNDLLGTTAFNANDIKQYKFGTTDKDKITVAPGAVYITGNYAAYDTFDFSNENSVPTMWNIFKSKGTAFNSAGQIMLKQEKENKGKISASRSFDAINDNACIETIFFLPEVFDGAGFKLMGGTKEIVDFRTESGSFYANDQKLRDYKAGLFWYTLRFEVDMNAKKVKIKISGKETATVDFKEDASAIDCFEAYLNSNGEATMYFDTVKIYNLINYEDYIAAPVKPKGEEKYNIGMNICSLWRNDSSHFGWDCVTPFDEVKPFLGYYDEGSPEVSDWEIKWMAEHGIDFELFCWYSSVSNSPIKTTQLSTAIHDGYFNAKYSDDVKFALLWEAMNAAHPENSEAFRNYFVTYWIEYFFTDPRYMVIDNKPVMSVFGAWQLMQDFGGAENVKKEFDYLRSEVKKLGFDDLIIMSCGGSSAELKACGFDACHAYNWGTDGYKLDTTKNNITRNIDDGNVHVVPTVSTGFNNIGWAGKRFPNMSVEDWTSAHTWIKDEILPTYKDLEKWKQNFVMLSTWNEYGEGTYIMPSGLNGFGYLDGIREVYTDGGEHTDIKPNEEQLKRINYLFPPYRNLIRPLEQSKKSESGIPKDTLIAWDFSTEEGSSAFHYTRIKQTITKDGTNGFSNSKDPIISTRNENLNLDISKVTHVKIRFKAKKGEYCQLYYLTDAMQGLSESASVGFEVETDEMKEYVLEVAGKTGWKGKLKMLRFDPIANDGEFTIASIELLYDNTVIGLLINGVEQTLNTPINFVDDEYYFAFNPGNGIQYYLNSEYTWNRAEKALQINANKHNIIFTIDSSKAIIDGAEIEIDAKPYLYDGVPMLPLKALCDVINYEYEISDKFINIKTNEFSSFKKMADRIPGDWEFDVDGDLESWYGASLSLAVSEGSLIGVTSDNAKDPMMWSPTIAIDTQKYDRIEISMKHTIKPIRKSERMGFYFTTNISDSWAEDKYVGATIDTETSGDKFIKYILDMKANKNWEGFAKQLRFDPFDTEGTFEIEYIKFLENSEYEKILNAPWTIKNGDAESDIIPFVSENATISIITDPTKDSNKVYKIEAKQGKNWTYFRQGAKFKSSQKYLVKFDVMLIGLSDGAENIEKAGIMLNMRYIDEGGNTDHVLGGIELGTSSKWQHFEKEITLLKSEDRSSDQFTIYANPVGETAVSYMVDNISITEIK